MRACLLERNRRVTDMLACAFAHVGIPLVRVASLPALLAATRKPGPDDFLILDLTLDGPDELARYAAVLGQAAVPVHAIYRDPALLPPLLERTAAPLIVLDANIGWYDLLDKLEALQHQIYAFRLASLPRRQAQVLRLLGEGHSRAEVAESLGIGQGTVKEHVTRLERALGVDRMGELRAIARLLEP